MKAKLPPFAWLLPTLILSCTEPFFPELDNFDQLLVIEGTVTSAPGPYVVKLATSARLDITRYEAESGADVFIREEGGGLYPLTEIVAGEYQTDSASFTGLVGRNYRVEVMLEDGRTYRSTYETIREAVGIDTVTREVQVRYFDEIQEEIPGYQFFVSSESTGEEEQYLLWQMEGTYKYTADFPIAFVYSGFLMEFEEPYKYFTCWRSYPVQSIATANTSLLTEKKVVDKPLYFLRGDDKKLSFRYSLLTRQFTISREAFEFWEGVRKQSASTSSLFTTQPFLIKGNLSNVDDDQEPVLGYFMAAGVSEHRLYVNNPSEFEVTFGSCGLDYEAYQWIFGEPASQWPIYVAEGPEGRAVSGEGCMDCREIGGSVTPPDWWIE